ncbi:ribonuclease H-like domain-containing protein [Candidatus Woesearchaeota archaeon]|nr:ribonuclease H-like domain-containing protein [Candidatus Woesearchaeota archaeon]
MITKSFIFLEKIGWKKEQNIRKQGIKDWQSFLNTEKVKGISGKAKAHYNRKIIEARKAISDNNSCYFMNKLPSVETWRLYDFFKEEAAFLDIEASRVNKEGFITVFGMYDGFNTKQMIKDINLDFKALKKELAHYKLIVTFNGSSFDIPFIEKRNPGLLPNVPHFDLRHACAKLGWKGGLKEIEKQLGIKRQNQLVERLYGGDPYLLWRMFKGSGDEHYLKLLADYNEEDVVNLKVIADKVVEKLKAQQFF